MAAAPLWPYSAVILFLICKSEKSADFSDLLFHGRGRNGKRHMLLSACGRNREELLGQRPAGCECRARHEADAGSRNPPPPAPRKQRRPCRAEHAAFALQTGLRLKSPTGAFMPCRHRRPFWFSFGTQKRTYPAAMLLAKRQKACPTRPHSAREAVTPVPLQPRPEPPQ